MNADSPLPEPLRRLLRKADATAETAAAAIRRAIREIRAELLLFADEGGVARSATERERAYAAVRRMMRRLEKRLAALLKANAEYSAQRAADEASETTGRLVKYSPERARETIALVTAEQGENLAAVFTENMSKRVIANLRLAVVSAMRENAVAGGKLKDLARLMGEKWQKSAKAGESYVFVDSGGNAWDGKRYFQMNARTTAMRVFNDRLCDDMARTTGSDLVRVSHGGDPHCDGCWPWEGMILSVSGADEDLPSYDQSKAAGCFHPNCVHTLEYVDPAANRDEIELQRAHPYADGDDPVQRRREIDQDRKRRVEGLSEDAARIAVLRDDLEAAIRNGLVREDARAVVAKMTDSQVEELCPGGEIPQFVPVKPTKKHPDPEKWRRGARGGVVHVSRDATAAHILAVCGVEGGA